MRTIVIQAGGESRRMGQDKAWQPFLGEALIQRVIQRLQPLADELLVTTNRPEGYESLGLRLAGDAILGRGALGGLYTALYEARFPFVGVVACDMPFTSAALLEAVFVELESTGCAAVIPQSENGTEPFHAVYRREACLPLVLKAIQADHWRVDVWFGQADIHFFSPETTLRFDPSGLAFHNVNTPEELAQAEQLAREIKGT